MDGRLWFLTAVSSRTEEKKRRIKKRKWKNKKEQKHTQEKKRRKWKGNKKDRPRRKRDNGKTAVGLPLWPAGDCRVKRKTKQKSQRVWETRTHQSVPEVGVCWPPAVLTPTGLIDTNLREVSAGRFVFLPLFLFSFSHTTCLCAPFLIPVGFYFVSSFSSSFWAYSVGWSGRRRRAGRSIANQPVHPIKLDERCVDERDPSLCVSETL